MNSLMYLLQIFAQTEGNTDVLAFSDGRVVPCSLSANMTLAEVTAEVVKVRNCLKEILTGTDEYRNL